MRSMTDPVNTGQAWRHAGQTGPPVDLYETAEAVIVRMAVPGVDGASISLTIDDESLHVRGESVPPGARWTDRTIVHWQEIPYGHFQRTVPLPTAVQRGGVKANYKNGVLEVTLPKALARTARTVQIQIT
jgi:HSP20 family protein